MPDYIPYNDSISGGDEFAGVAYYYWAIAITILVIIVFVHRKRSTEMANTLVAVPANTLVVTNPVTTPTTPAPTAADPCVALLADTCVPAIFINTHALITG